MRIAFDYQAFAIQRYGGISRYFTSLARELAAMGEDPRIIAPAYRTRYLAELPDRILTGWSLEGHPSLRNRHVQRAVNRTVSRVAMSALRPDVVHETYFSEARSGPRGTPTVITVFDMVHELYASEFTGSATASDIKRRAVARADHVICISESTRRDLVRMFGVPAGRVSVIHLAADPAPVDPPRPAAADRFDYPFLLFVGGRWGYKNFKGLLAAYGASPSLRRDFRIVAVGAGELDPEERTIIRDLGLGDRIVQVDGDDALLDHLYRTAAALVYASAYEGFGLPPLEAMARGCPVIASNTSSMPEVIGDAGAFFDPKDPAQISRAIESVVYSEDQRRSLAARGSERFARFSWRRCAEETLAVYRSLVSSPAAVAAPRPV